MRKISCVLFVSCSFMSGVIFLLVTRRSTDKQPRTMLDLKQTTTKVNIDEQWLFLFSAVAELDSSSSKNYSRVILSAWDGSNKKSFSCYFKLDKMFTLVPAVQIRIKDNKAKFISKQFACDISFLSKLPNEIALVESIDSKPYPSSIEIHFIKNYNLKNSYFHKIYYPERRKGQIAICTKIAYDRLNPDRLVEWFEYQRLMGVDKVLSAVQTLNPEAVQVLEYYRKQGFLEIIKYPKVLPSHNTEYAKRGFDTKHRVFPQFFHDEQISVYHCKERLQGYEFVSVTDFDEFIVPAKQKTIKQLLKDDLLKNQPKAAGFTFNVSFFLTDSNQTEKSDLVTAKYLYKVGPRYECYKNLVLTDRVDTYSTHHFFPNSGFSKQIIPSEIAVLHHYRDCPGGPNWGDCSKQRRDRDTVMKRHTKELEDLVKKAKKEIKKIVIDKANSEFL